jgi:hypothetical protein
MNGGEATRAESTPQQRLSVHCRVVQAPGVLAAPSDGELLLIREETSDCYVLRGSGADIWEAARQPVTVAGICEALRRLYEVDPETCKTNVLRQVEELLHQDLFVRAS